jgi:hypothetical protein
MYGPAVKYTYIWFQSFTEVIYDEVFSGYQPCRCGVGARDCLCLRYHQPGGFVQTTEFCINIACEHNTHHVNL